MATYGKVPTFVSESISSTQLFVDVVKVYTRPCCPPAVLHGFTWDTVPGNSWKSAFIRRGTYRAAIAVGDCYLPDRSADFRNIGYPSHVRDASEQIHLAKKDYADPLAVFLRHYWCYGTKWSDCMR